LPAWWGQQVAATCKEGFRGEGDQALVLVPRLCGISRGKHAERGKVVALGRERAELIKPLI